MQGEKKKDKEEGKKSTSPDMAQQKIQTPRSVLYGRAEGTTPKIEC